MSVAGSIGDRAYSAPLGGPGRIRRLRAILPESRGVRAATARRARPPDAARAHGTTSASTPGSGCATATTPRSSRTSRRRTPTPRAALAHLAPLRAELFDEIVGRVQETDTTAPIRRGDYEYFTRTVEGLQYGVHCRRPARHRRRAARSARRAGHARRRGRRARRERARRRSRLLRGRRPRGQPRPDRRRLQHRHQRRRALRARVPRPSATTATPRRRPRRRRARRLLRRGVGERQRHALLHASRRRDAPVADLAAHARHPGRPTTSSCSRRTTTASTSASAAPAAAASS